MTPDTLPALWQAAPAPPPLRPDTLADLRSDAADFDRAIRLRDLREYAAAVLVVVLFARSWPAGTVPVRVGVVLTVLGAAFACLWMWRAQRRRPPAAPTAPTVEALRIAVERVDIQIGLLRSITWWYLVPVMLGPLVVVTAGTVMGWTPSLATPKLALVTVLMVVVMGLVYAGMGAMLAWTHRKNQRAVETELLPLRARLLDSLKALTDDVRTDDA